MDNGIKVIDPKRDVLYSYSEEAQRELTRAEPWAKDPTYFTSVRISAVALLKMVMHARSGGSIEVMGLMQGWVAANTLVVTDAFRLPVEGTETRVNAQSEAEEYLIEYLTSCREQGRMENVVGWYHSHPGYGCWLSGIDVATQQLQQRSGPFVAVVIDPERTISSGKVDIGAFRTFPDNYKPDEQVSRVAPGLKSRQSTGLSVHDDDDTSDLAPVEGTIANATGASSRANDSVPLAKAKDFGAHAAKYYSLEVSCYRSSIDAVLIDRLWHKFWAQTIATSPLLVSRGYAARQMTDLAAKLRLASDAITTANRANLGAGGVGDIPKNKRSRPPVDDSDKSATASGILPGPPGGGVESSAAANAGAAADDASKQPAAAEKESAHAGTSKASARGSAKTAPALSSFSSTLSSTSAQTSMPKDDNGKAAKVRARAVELALAHSATPALLDAAVQRAVRDGRRMAAKALEGRVALETKRTMYCKSSATEEGGSGDDSMMTTAS